MPTTITVHERLPFFTGLQDSPVALQHVPAYLPFHLTVDEEGRVCQAVAPVTEAALRTVYRVGSSLSTVPGEMGYAGQRGDELLERLRAAVGTFRAKRVLEIGCGNGYVLGRLADEGASCYGCEPGPGADEANRRQGVQVLRAEFAADLFEPSSFDLVFSSMVLEHVPDPVRFLTAQLRLLRPDGMLVAAVPECDRQLATGDLSMPAHEHITYFTRETLTNSILAAGGANCVVTSATQTLSYFASAARATTDQPRPRTNVVSAFEDARRYAQLFQKRLTILGQYADGLRDKRLALCGISVGASVVTGLVDLRRVTLAMFDIDTEKIGRYLPNVHVPVQDEAELSNFGPDEVWVIPSLGAERIRRKILEKTRMPPETVVSLPSVRIR